MQLGNALSVRSAYHSLFSKDIFANRGMWLAVIGTVILQLSIVYIPFLDTIFKTAPLSWDIFLVIIATTAVSVVLIELVKLLNRKFFTRKSHK